MNERFTSVGATVVYCNNLNLSGAGGNYRMERSANVSFGIVDGYNNAEGWGLLRAGIKNDRFAGVRLCCPRRSKTHNWRVHFLTLDSCRHTQLGCVETSAVKSFCRTR